MVKFKISSKIFHSPFSTISHFFSCVTLYLLFRPVLYKKKKKKIESELCIMFQSVKNIAPM